MRIGVSVERSAYLRAKLRQRKWPLIVEEAWIGHR
jgi:hypothetical protein